MWHYSEFNWRRSIQVRKVIDVKSLVYNTHSHTHTHTHTHTRQTPQSIMQISSWNLRGPGLRPDPCLTKGTSLLMSNVIFSWLRVASLISARKRSSRDRNLLCTDTSILRCWNLTGLYGQLTIPRCCHLSIKMYNNCLCFLTLSFYELLI